MDSDDGKEKGGVTAVRKGEAMKSLEKATADYEKAKAEIKAKGTDTIPCLLYTSPMLQERLWQKNSIIIV